MAGFEDVILKALQRQDANSPAVREQVYNSARNTLAKMLDDSGSLSPENIQDQRQRLEQAISNIESGYITPDTLYAETGPGIVAPPEPSGPARYDEPGGRDRSIFTRRPFAILLLSTIVVVALGMASWWVYDQGLTRPAAMRDTSVPNPPRILAEESSPPDDGAPQDPGRQRSGQNPGEWLTLFDPGDPRGLATQAASSAELGRDQDGDYVRLSGQGSDPSASVLLSVEPGLMETMHGKTVTFELRTKSGDGADLQFVITCQFNSSGDCGRKRFTTGAIAETFVFNVNVADGSAADENKSGSISLIADISGQGRPLDLYLFRISVR